MGIKAVELVRKIRNEIYGKTKSMSSKEEIKYFREMSRKFREKHIRQDKVVADKLS